MSAWGVACCRTCNEPLVMTFERAGKEFICVPCDRWYEFLEPVGRPETPELMARHDELKAEYLLARATRESTEA